MTLSREDDETKREIEVPMPARSLLLLREAARHQLKHEIKREHIRQRRLCVTIRSLADGFIAEQPAIAQQILSVAKIRL